MADTKTGGVLTLRICTPAGVTDTLECDSVSFAIPDGADGSGGGRIGIRPGHIAALIAVAPGGLEASRGGRELLRREIGKGFVSVWDNTLTLLLE